MKPDPAPCRVFLCPEENMTEKPKNTDLPPGGLSRFRSFQHLIPCCREQWRLLVKAGKAPQPLRLGPKTTVWKNDELKEWLKDPLAWPVADQTAPDKTVPATQGKKNHPRKIALAVPAQ